MQDPLQIDLGDRKNGEIIVRPRDAMDSRVRAYGIPANPDNEVDDLAALMQYVWILWKHRWVLLLTGVLGTLAGLVVVLLMTPMYHAKTTLEIQNIPQQFGQPVADSSIETQVQLLSSLMLRKRALSKLPQNEAQDLNIVGPVAGIRELLKMKDPAKTIDWSDAAGTAARVVTVKLAKENSDVVEIESDSPNPQATAAFTDTLAREYIQFIEEQRLDSYQNSSSWMSRELQDLKSKIESDQKQLSDFAREKGLIFTDATAGTSGTQTVGEEKLKALQTELLEAETDRIKKQAQTEARQSTAGGSSSALDSVPLSSLQSQLATARAQLATLRTTLTDKNPKVQEVLNSIAVLEGEQKNEQGAISSRNHIDNSAAEIRENQLKHEFETQSQLIATQSNDLIKYNIMQRDIDTNKRLYDEMQAQGKQAGIASAMRSSSAHVIDTAVVPEEPIRPNLPFMLSLGLLGGFCCGGGFVIVRSRLDLTIKEPGALEIQFNVRELGVIPSARSDHRVRRLRAFSKPVRTTANGNHLAPVECLEMLAQNDVPSIMAEAFRSTATSLLFSPDNEDQPRVLVFTSASSGEGKTTVISNVAISLAQTNNRVLLVDADMRLPRVHSIFDVPNNFGLSDVLNDRKPVEDYIEESLVRKTRISNLYVLPAGPARANMTRLVNSTRMKELLGRLRESFDFILIDTAPVLVVPDSRIFARAADAVVLVVRANQTHQNAAFTAANRFTSDGTRILGTILNDWRPGVSMHEYGGSYGQTGYFQED